MRDSFVEYRIMVSLSLGLIHTPPAEPNGADNTPLETKVGLQSLGENEPMGQDNRTFEEHSLFKNWPTKKQISG